MYHQLVLARIGHTLSHRCGNCIEATKVTGTYIVIHLLICCDELVQKEFTHTACGTLTRETEGEVLEAMKRLNIRQENKIASVVVLHNMHRTVRNLAGVFGEWVIV